MESLHGTRFFNPCPGCKEPHEIARNYVDEEGESGEYFFCLKTRTLLFPPGSTAANTTLGINGFIFLKE